MSMLEGEESLTLDLLNQATQAWVEQEYHRTLHSELGTTPLARYLAGPHVRRECPDPSTLAAAFRVEVARRQRRSDGTVRLEGTRFEIPAAYRHLGVVSLRYARWDLARVDLVDARFDSQPLLCVVLAGDARLIEKLRREELIPLGSRIRTRLATEHATREELQACLSHLLAGAGNASLMTPQLQQTLCDHAAGNYRILTALAAELLAAAVQRDLPQLDEKLYLEAFAQPETPAPRRAAAGR